MNKISLLLTLFGACYFVPVNAQIGLGTSNPRSESLLDAQSTFTDKGILLPRLNIEDLSTLDPVETGTASEGLLVYNTNTTTGKGFYYWNGINAWIPLNVAPNAGLQFFSYNSGTGASPNVANISFTRKPNKSGRYLGNLQVTDAQFPTFPLKPSNNEGFTIKLVGYYEVKSPGLFNFKVTSDDGTRIYIDDVLVYDKWIESSNTTTYDSVNLSKGKHKFEFWYYENGGDQAFHFEWNTNPDGLPHGTMSATQFTID